MSELVDGGYDRWMEDMIDGWVDGRFGNGWRDG